MTPPVDDVAARLESIADELADLAMDRLRQAVSSPEDRDRLVAEERRLTRARRAVAKAAHLLQERGEVD